jgi:hypothetical protein
VYVGFTAFHDHNMKRRCKVNDKDFYPHFLSDVHKSCIYFFVENLDYRLSLIFLQIRRCS